MHTMTTLSSIARYTVVAAALLTAAAAQAAGSARDPFTEGARSVTSAADPYTDGARSVHGTRSPYYDGARGEVDPYLDGAGALDRVAPRRPDRAHVSLPVHGALPSGPRNRRRGKL
jgi:hypothetical protein